MSKNELFINKSSNNIIVCFSGNSLKFAGVTQFEFVKTLNLLYPDYDKLFLQDDTSRWYLYGINGISNNIIETKNYIQKKIKKYKNITFIGTSSGGYAAILFGSLLNINKVISFIPQTNLNVIKRKNIINDNNKKYIDLKKFINNNTKYFLIGKYSNNDKNDLHSIHQCNYLQEFSNVKIIKIKKSLIEIRNNKYLNKLLQDIID
jgi:hypothetical protein